MGQEARAKANAFTRHADKRNKQAIFKNCAPFTACISEINTAQVNNQVKDFVAPTYNLIEYSNNYSKKSGCLWQYCRDEPSVNMTDSESFKFKARITGANPPAGNTKDVDIAAPLKYLGNF